MAIGTIVPYSIGYGSIASTSVRSVPPAAESSPRDHDAEPAPPPAETLYDRRWWALAVLCLSLLIVFVGNSSLNVTLPTLSTDLHATESQLQWVVASYSLVFAGPAVHDRRAR